MNSLKKLIYIGATGSLLCMTACKKDFLDENLVTARSTQDFETKVGLDGLVIGMYQSLRFHFNYEWAYTTTNYGVDEFTVGGDRTMQMWNSYDGNLNSLTGDAASVWDNMYGAINSANIVIQNVPLFYDDASTKDVRLGEGYFMRAFNYFKLVKQFGGVPIKLIPSTTVEFEFPRNTIQEVYEQVIGDFKKAFELLPPAPAQRGRITKWAAAHFLAKVYLNRASEINASWNTGTKAADLDAVINYGNQVINSGAHVLAPDFKDLWNYTGPNSANEALTEIILSAQFSDNTATQGRYGNQMHLYFPSIYQTLAGMVRDIPGGREFQRCRTTDYAVDVYDRVNDSRFWKSFKTRYLCNNPNGAPKWEATNAPDPSQVGKVRFTGGQEAVLYIANNAGDTRYTADNIKLRAPHMFIRYYAGQAEDPKGNHGNYDASRFITMSKYSDGSRETVASQFGRRDGILARLAETYLLVAEAHGRKGDYDAALPLINKVRDRAAFKTGEDRSLQVDGGISYKNNAVANTAAWVSYSDKNTYYESNNNMPVTTASTLTDMHINTIAEIFSSNKEFYAKLGIASDADKFVNFILNERSRELMGELHRWEDLARTKTLVARCEVFNNEAKPQPNKHYLRPIPQSFLDAIKKNGLPLTGEEKSAMQNPNW
ncbi:RagB/SusD family nutrient uptake outer membrane protein [Paraflavitalea pollutisoli]|uniref:RagB/SusD family nutrient uptake outer membrane protein n=1 Tax=Paraflavitalea pollutisoli TaxID=3034143 RepID=UPI0023EBC118|nr:RagB/SusD family nutrient uptake outer membrane protein [Paraflavitalea sp. H1-2-19X]